MKSTIEIIISVVIGLACATGAYLLGHSDGKKSAQLDVDSTHSRISIDALEIAQNAAEETVYVTSELEICKSDLRTTFNALESCLEDNPNQMVEQND